MGSPLSVGFYRVFFLSVDRLVLPIDDSFGALLGVKRFYQSEVHSGCTVGRAETLG